MSLRCLNELGIGGTVHISRQHVLVFLDPTHTTYLSADVSVFHVQFEYDIRYFENPPTYFFLPQACLTQSYILAFFGTIAKFLMINHYM